MSFKLGIVLTVLAVCVMAQTNSTILPSGYWQIQTGEFDQVNGDILVAQADFNQDRLYDSIVITVPTLSQSIRLTKLV
jgi:hypothetical protein